MKNSVLKVGMIAHLVMTMAIPAIVPNVIFAQANVRQEDRRADSATGSASESSCRS